MKKIDLIKAQQSTTMFLLDSKIEEKYEGLIKQSISNMKSQISGLDSKEGFENFIRSNKDSIDQIVTLLGISKEKFKRVVSWIRISQGYVFDSEWSPSTLRTKMISDSDSMDLYYELFTQGYKSEKFTSIVPQFIISDFKLDKDVQDRLNNEDYIKNLVKSKFSIAYNGEYCDLYYKTIREKFKEIADANDDITFSIEEKVLGTHDTTAMAFIGNDKIIYLNTHFYLTTSSNQTSYAEDISKMRSQLRNYPNAIMINFLDGAGWIGRASDFKKIYHDCDYYLNLKTIHMLNDIINDFLNK